MALAFSPMMLLSLVIGYLCGSIPFGLLLTRAAGLGDIRAIGSGNIGATNVLRTGNRWLAAATLALDALKGTLAVHVTSLIGVYTAFHELHRIASDATAVSSYASVPSVLVYAMAGGFGAFIGHLYPVWLGFKGGKGVATYIGVLLGLHWPAALIFCAVWLLVAALTRYSSLSALIASGVAPIAIWGLGRLDVAVLLVPLSALLIVKHRANIVRLRAGTEPRIGRAKPSDQPSRPGEPPGSGTAPARNLGAGA